MRQVAQINAEVGNTAFWFGFPHIDIALLEVVTGAEKHTSDHTQPHLSGMLHVVRGETGLKLSTGWWQQKKQPGVQLLFKALLVVVEEWWWGIVTLLFARNNAP